MKYGTLHITTPDGKSHDYSIDAPNFSIGRAPGNDVVVEDTSVSRRHARFTVESGRLMIEDCGSANGTFVGHQRVPSNTSSLVPDDQVVCLGDVEIRYTPPPTMEAPQVFTPSLDKSVPPEPSGPPISISLVGPSQPVAPGNAVAANLTVQNRSAIVDELVIRVSGVPIDWVRISKDRVPLLPNAQETITITFAPPRRSDAVAADHSFTISAVSREHHTGANARGTLKVLPYQNFTMQLEPQRSQRDFEVMVSNQGNAPTAYRFSGVDDEHGLTYQFGQEAVTLQAGQSGVIPLQIAPKIARKVGAREMRSFTVIATPLDPLAAAAKTAGQLIIRPPIPIWLIAVALLLSALACVAVASVYAQVCGTLGPNMPLCPSGAKPTINVFEVKPLEVEKGGLVAATWDVGNAEKVELTQPFQETLPKSGVKTFVVEQSTNFTLKATNFAGSIDKTVSVKLKGAPPIVQSFRAEPEVVVIGQQTKIVLSWVVVGADAVSIAGVSAANLGATGSLEIEPPAADKTYTLTATNDNGTAQQPLTIRVSSAGCVTIMPTNLYEGPSRKYRVIDSLASGIAITPIGRNSTGEWLRIQTQKEGWAPVDAIQCAALPPLQWPTINPGLIPLEPTDTPTPTFTPTPTHTPTPTPTPTPAPTPTYGPVTVPVVAGRTVEEAAALIRASGLNVRSTTSEYHPTISKGLVIRSDPDAGNSVRWGTPVTLVVSLGTGQRRITVTFTKVTVHDDADGFALGAGDIWFDFRVNGQVGRWPSSGTRDIDSGDTVTIDLRLEITVAQSETLSLFMKGTDDDDTSANDSLGTVSQEYSSANNWGQGAHNVRSTCPDGCYTIYYTISVVELP
jgi:hypothetical protein